MFLNYICANQCKPQIFQIMNFVRANKLSLKYQRIKTLGCKDIGISKIEFFGKESIPLYSFFNMQADRCHFESLALKQQVVLFGFLKTFNKTCKISKLYSVKVCNIFILTKLSFLVSFWLVFLHIFSVRVKIWHS